MRVKLIRVLKYPELRRKLLFTLAALALFRLLAHIPVMAHDSAQLDRVIRDDQYVFAWEVGSGGALSSLSVLSLGISPFAGATVLLGFLALFRPQMEEWARYDRGRLKRSQYWLTIPMALLQAWFLFGYLARQGVVPRFSFAQADLLYTLTKLVMLTAGAFFVTWLADLITEQGIGQGPAVLVFGGIAARLPDLARQLLEASPWVVALVVLALIVVLVLSIYVHEGQRRISIMYPSRMVPGRKRLTPLPTMPVPINRVGTGPLELSLGLISTAAFLALPLAGSGAGWAVKVVGLLKGPPAFWVLYACGTLLLAILYQDIAYSGQALADALRRQGGRVVGIRPGEATARYLEVVSNRIGSLGVVYLVAMAVFPYLLVLITGVESVVFDAALAVLLSFDTVIDAVLQLEAELLLAGEGYTAFVR